MDAKRTRFKRNENFIENSRNYKTVTIVNNRHLRAGKNANICSWISSALLGIIHDSQISSLHVIFSDQLRFKFNVLVWAKLCDLQRGH